MFEPHPAKEFSCSHALCGTMRQGLVSCSYRTQSVHSTFPRGAWERESHRCQRSFRKGKDEFHFGQIFTFFRDHKWLSFYPDSCLNAYRKSSSKRLASEHFSVTLPHLRANSEANSLYIHRLFLPLLTSRRFIGLPCNVSAGF